MLHLVKNQESFLCDLCDFLCGLRGIGFLNSMTWNVE